MRAGGDEPNLLASARFLGRRFIDRYAVPAWLHEDVHGDARLAIVLLAEEHDPALSTWPSYLAAVGVFRLIDVMRQRSGRNPLRRVPVPFGDLDLDLTRLIPAQRDGSEEVVERLTEEAQLRQFREALPSLNHHQAYVIRRYFLEGAVLSQIGKELGVTESRACQLKQAALELLRHRMTA